MQIGDLSTSTKAVTKNPLGIIALFIFLIYSIASLILGVAADALTVGQKWVFVVFLGFFPILVLGSFVWLVVNHSVKLYSPADFRDDNSYIALNRKLRVMEIKQDAHEVDPRGNIEDAKVALSELMSIDEIDTAISVAKGFLKVGRHSQSLSLFEEIGKYLQNSGRPETKILSYKAYCLIGLENYTEASKVLQALRMASPGEFDFWPRIALSYSLLKTGRTAESSELLEQAASDKMAEGYLGEVTKRYPELATEFSTKLAGPA